MELRILLVLTENNLYGFGSNRHGQLGVSANIYNTVKPKVIDICF